MDVSQDDPGQELAASFDEAYRVFGRYRIKGRLEACDCGCITERDHARIRSGPLRELTAESLERYASKAMTTWGDGRDFRHFLPRILELVTGDPRDEICNEIALSKLSYAGWWGWPECERHAVENVLRLRWHVGLTLSPDEFDADTWLCSVFVAGVDTAPYVDAWRTSTSDTAVHHAAAFLVTNYDLMTRGTLRNAFYFDEGVTVAEPIREWLGAAMADEAFQERLAARWAEN